MPENMTLELLDAAKLPIPEERYQPENGNGAGSFFRNIIVFSASNLLYLLIASATTFVVPKWLSIEAFATYRYFLLFGGFAGALHLGSVDGALIEWVRKPDVELTLGWMPLVEFIAILHIGAMLLGGLIVLLFMRGDVRTTWMLILFLLPVANGLALAQYGLQAVRRFSTLSALTVFTPVCTLLVVVALHWMHRATGFTVITGYLLSNGLSAGAGIVSLRRNVLWSPVPVLKALRLGRKYLVIGWSVLIFNLLANFMISADRFFVVAHFSTLDFAEYSFAGAIFYSIFLVMLSVSKVLFPYLADTQHVSSNIPYVQAREGLLILWALSLSFYFPVEALIDRMLPRYAASMPLVRLLLLATASVMLIQILHANYFRLVGKQRTMTVAAIAGAAITFVCLLLVAPLHNLSAIALATVAGCTFWGLLGEFLLLKLLHTTARSLLRTVAGLCLFIAVFLFASEPQHSLMNGFVLQLILSTSVAALVFFPTIASIQTVLTARFLNKR